MQLYSTADGQRRLVEDVYATVKSSRKPGFGPMAGAGAAAGAVAASAAAAAGVGAVTAHSQTVEGDARNMARQIARELARFFLQQGWITPDQANALRFPL